MRKGVVAREMGFRFCEFQFIEKGNLYCSCNAADGDPDRIGMCPYSADDVDFGRRLGLGDPPGFYIENCPDFRPTQEFLASPL